MGTKISSSVEKLAVALETVAVQILETQRKTGEIPWCEGQKTDPWDHIEAAMGLSIAGYRREAELAYEWMVGIAAQGWELVRLLHEGRP